MGLRPPWGIVSPPAAAGLWLRQFADDMSGKVLLDFPVPGYGLTDAGSGISVPIMASPMANEPTAVPLDAPDEIPSLHAICNSPTRRGDGIWPDVTSW